MMEAVKLCLIAGDGIGKEVTDQSLKVIKAVCAACGLALDLSTAVIGAESIESDGIPLTQETIEKCRAAQATLLGAVGGPLWETLPAAMRPEQALYGLRAKLGLFANIRPVRTLPPLESLSPLKQGASGIDMLLIRETTGDIYFGEKGIKEFDGQEAAYDLMLYHEYEISRVAQLAFDCCVHRGGHLICIDKADLLECSRMWRRVVQTVGEEYPGVEVEFLHADRAAIELIRCPERFSVVLTSNLFGDILYDEASILTGALGVIPSASVGHGSLGLYKPIHGPYHELAGTGRANPIASIRSAAMMFRHTFHMEAATQAINRAVCETLMEVRTPDLHSAALPDISTSEMGDEVAARVSKLLLTPPQRM